jgi:hypothetical protein
MEGETITQLLTLVLAGPISLWGAGIWEAGKGAQFLTNSSLDAVCGLLLLHGAAWRALHKLGTRTIRFHQCVIDDADFRRWHERVRG